MAHAAGTALQQQSAPTSAAPQNLSPADEKAVQAVIAAQLAAFAKGDAVKAFSYAAPNIRQAMNSDAEGFMAMVRKSYPVVYRPSSVVFLKPERHAGVTGGVEQIIQRVQMQDSSGEAWLAVYGLERPIEKGKKGATPGKTSAAGVWRINGCVVTQNKGRMA